jgi:hypothetical protein
MNVIDSTFWLEYFSGTEAGNIVSEIIESTDKLMVPATSIKFNCILWTQDKHFMNLDFVNYFEKIK